MYLKQRPLEDSLFHQFRHMEREMDRLFDAVGLKHRARVSQASNYPPVSLATSTEQVDIALFAAGMDPDGFEITVDRNQLVVHGKRVLAKEEQAEGFLRKERFDGEFHHVINLPDDIDESRVDAHYENGVLLITIPRREPPKPIQIKVQ
ncbi:MAG: Hsp20/alpha crystallin family protein [Candidatus Thiodiazotropha sp.]